MQFYGVKESKIRWSVLEIKFIKGKNFKKINLASAKSKIWSKNLGKMHKNREKKLQFYGVKESKI